MAEALNTPIARLLVDFLSSPIFTPILISLLIMIYVNARIHIIKSAYDKEKSRTGHNSESAPIERSGGFVRAVFSKLRRKICKNTRNPNISENKPGSTDEPNVASEAETVSRVDPLKYYEYVRKEIEREDAITNNRMTWLMTFQGFLVGAMGVLVSFAWTGVPDSVLVFRRMALVAVGILGLEIGVNMFKGIYASRQSIRNVHEDWKARNVAWDLYPKQVPQPSGQGESFEQGAEFAEFIPQIFSWMWAVYLAGLISVYFIFEINPCILSGDFHTCLSNMISSTSP